MNEPLNHPKRRVDVNVRLIDDEVVALDRQADLIHQLNHTASYIWDRRDGQSTVAEIANQFAAAFHVDAHTAICDVATTISQLHSLGLLESLSNLPEGP